jgi:Protein involved in meta-pathway of phenol degradation
MLRAHHLATVLLTSIGGGMMDAPANAGQGFGPRAFQLVPDGSNVLSTYVIRLEGNQGYEPGSVFQRGDVTINLAVAQYTRAFEIGGNQGAIFGVLPYGEVSGSLDAKILGRIEGHASGFFDAQVGVVYGLIGSPALALPAYAQFEPGFQLGALANVYVPIGKYDSDKALNTGSNRWAAMFGLPMSYNIGSSLVAPDLGTIELLPSVTVFGDNNDPFGPADTTGQRPLFTAEGHITRNLNKMIWLSLDGMYTYGGESTSDGRAGGDVQNHFAVGGTINVNFSPSFSMKASYGEIIYNHNDKAEGRMFRLMGTGVF